VEPHNFPAWMDYLPAMLSDFENNKPEIERAFEVQKELDIQWSPLQFGIFAFFEGCVQFLNGNPGGAIKLWLNSITLDNNGKHWRVNFKRQFDASKLLDSASSIILRRDAGAV